MAKTRFKIRHQYDDEADAEARAATDIVNNEPSLTQQQYTDDVNLNTMMKKMGVSDGAIPPAAMDPRYFGDFTDAADLRTSIDRVREAEQRFDELPAELRSRFNNNPAELFAFVQEDKNADEAVKLGLLHRAHSVVIGGTERAADATPATLDTPPK